MLSPLSLSSDLSSCTRCAGVRSVSLRDFRDAMADREYRDLPTNVVFDQDRLESFVFRLGAARAGTHHGKGQQQNRKHED